MEFCEHPVFGREDLLVTEGALDFFTFCVAFFTVVPKGGVISALSVGTRSLEIEPHLLLLCISLLLGCSCLRCGGVVVLRSVGLASVNSTVLFTRAVPEGNC